MIISAGEAVTATTGAAAVEIALDMAPRRQYRLTARTNACWYRVTTAGGAAAAAAASGSHPLAAGQSVLVAAIGGQYKYDGTDNTAIRNRVSVIQDGGAGTATLSEVPVVQPM
jgi:hypothetical protein